MYAGKVHLNLCKINIAVILKGNARLHLLLPLEQHQIGSYKSHTNIENAVSQFLIGKLGVDNFVVEITS